MKVIAIIQARCGSSRFPNKIFAELSGKPLIWHVVNRLKSCQKVDDIVLATTINPLDDALELWAKQQHVHVFRGEEDNVLSRFYEAAVSFSADIVVRITADDPFKDPELIDAAIDKIQTTSVDFVCNNNPPTFPEGLDVEVFTFNALHKAQMESKSAFEREHVTQYFYKHPELFKRINIEHTVNLSNLRWTIDTALDFQMAKTVYSYLFDEHKSIFLMNDILSVLEQHPEIAEINANVSRSEMYKSNK